jgi:hypothetical protein
MTADAKSGGYPRFTIAGMSSEPVAARSAAALPLMPAMMTFATTDTWASPPLM